MGDARHRPRINRRASVSLQALCIEGKTREQNGFDIDRGGAVLQRYTSRRVRHINYARLVPPDEGAGPRPAAAPPHRSRVVRVEVLQRATLLQIPQAVLLEEFQFISLARRPAHVEAVGLELLPFNFLEESPIMMKLFSGRELDLVQDFHGQSM